MGIQLLARLAYQRQGGESVIEKWLQYTCDGCGETETADAPNESVAECRRRIREYGWVNHGRLDYCPDCVKDGAAKRREEGFLR